MLLILENDSKEKLSVLSQVQSDVAKEYCEAAREFILKGTNQKVYSIIAQKSGIDAFSVRKCVESLMYLLSESAKHNLSQLELEDSLLSLGLSASVKEQLSAIHGQSCTELRNVLAQSPCAIPHFRNLHWRLDIQLGSRSLHHQTNPLVVLQLTLSDQQRPLTLQTDPTNLQRMLTVLEQALAEAKSQYTRRTLRGLK